MVFFTCGLILHTFYVFGPLPAFLNMVTSLSDVVRCRFFRFLPREPCGGALLGIFESIYSLQFSCD